VVVRDAEASTNRARHTAPATPSPVLVAGSVPPRPERGGTACRPPARHPGDLGSRGGPM